MPQMAPIWWTLMFTTFILSFLTIWTIMYYQIIHKPSEKSMINNKENNLIWKW